MDQEPTEYELALRARDGDREALAKLVERTRFGLFALAYAELRHYDDAQDAVAAALLQVCLHVGELRQPERIRAWMHSIVRNEAHRLRRGGGSSLLPLEEAEMRTESAGPSLLLLDIERALRRLPGNQAEAVRLFYLHHLSLEEIAQRLGRPQGTIGSWLHRGRQHLARELEGYAPMTTTGPKTTPSRSAAIVHTDFDPTLLQMLVGSFQADGYRTDVTTPSDLSQLVSSLKSYDCLLLDEWVCQRPAVEILLNVRANPETREIPVCVFYRSDLPDITWSAYFIAGADRLVRRTAAETQNDIAALPESLRGLNRRVYAWLRHTLRARRALSFAEEEAMGLGASAIAPEHLLLGLVRESDNVASTALERLGLSLESIQSEILKRAAHSAEAVSEVIQFTPEARRVLDLTFMEAKRLNDNFIGTEHQLLGLVRAEEEGGAGAVLTQLGASLERTRQTVDAMRADGSISRT